jgi:hypothetical protein
VGLFIAAAVQRAGQVLAIQPSAVIAFDQNSDVALFLQVMGKSHRLIKEVEFLEQAPALLKRADGFGARRTGINPVHDAPLFCLEWKKITPLLPLCSRGSVLRERLPGMTAYSI